MKASGFSLSLSAALRGKAQGGSCIELCHFRPDADSGIVDQAGQAVLNLTVGFRFSHRELELIIHISHIDIKRVGVGRQRRTAFRKE